MIYQHFPVIAVMGLFLAAFLVEIFGSKNKYIRNAIVLIATTGALVLIALLTKPVLIDGELISYWMGNWNIVEGFAIGIGYEMDKLSFFFAGLVALTFWLSSIYSIKYMERDHHLGHYYTLFLMLSGSVLGLVMTGDIFNMFVMVEIMTFAAVALTAFRKKTALEAAFKYLVIGSVGSGFTLTGIALLYMQTHTLNMANIAQLLSSDGLTPTTLFAFALMLGGFGVKSFIVPFHAPAADAYMSAPTSVSMIFSGMVNKAGVYGMIRICYTVFKAMDTEAIQIVLVVLGTITMFVGVTMALAQHDFKRLLAFHSISQIGYVIMAIGLATTSGLTSGLFHAANHTLFKGLLFLTAGAVLYATGTTNLDKLGGLSKRMPKTCICFLIGALSISGIPPFNGFSSKYMIYQAAYEKAVTTGNFLYTIVTIAAVVVSVMTLASFIKVTHSVFFGQLHEEHAQVKEAPFLMRLPMWIMSVLCLAAGVFYKFVTKNITGAAALSVQDVSGYVDAMMGDGVAAASGVTNYTLGSISAEQLVWNPITWLILFATVLAAGVIGAFVILRDRGVARQSTSKEVAIDGKYGTFFSGEKSEVSHVGGSDLFWGFKKNWKGYFKFMDGLHSGNVNDYATMAVAALSLIAIVVFIFVK